MAFRFIVTLALVAGTVSAQGSLSRIPGAQTAAGILASSADGMSRYLAPDGPIQPGLTAIMGLPMRAGEQANRGLTSISSGFNSGAQSMSRAAGQGGQIRMPGMQALESNMPAPLASLGSGMQSMIRGKNNFIRGQAESGIAAGNRLGQMMREGLQVRSSGPMASVMEGPAQMMSSAQDFMSKSSSEVQNQLKGHLNDAMNRLGSMQGIGENLRNQAQGYGRTLSNGVQGAMGHLQQTGQNMMGQLQRNHAQNTQALSGVMGSLQGSMGNMNANMQKNFDGVVRHAQSTAHQLTSTLQSAVQAPMQMLSSLTSSLGSMMQGAGGHGGMSSSGGRY